uniref:basic proline-rich protein-like n=1 Tax=Callithrix jacchus TaxID=9483 RepID=UPI0023DD4622|nr:basic proline-rich protein-like [Callithrix jacchus]
MGAPYLGSKVQEAPPWCRGLLWQTSAPNLCRPQPCGTGNVFLTVSQSSEPGTPTEGSGHGLPAPGRTPKLRGPPCPARPAPYLAGAVLQRRRRRHGGWAAQSHIVPGRGGRSQLRVTSAANNEGFDRRGARPARSPAPRPPQPPGPPGPAPPRPLPGSDYSAAGPPQPPQCRSRPPRPARRGEPRAAAASGRARATLPLPLPEPGGLRPGASGLKRGFQLLPRAASAAPGPEPLSSRQASPSNPGRQPDASAEPPAPRHPLLGPAASPPSASLRAGVPQSSSCDPAPRPAPGSAPCAPSSARARAHRDPLPSATHTRARPWSAQDRLEEGPESRVALCTRPCDNPESNPGIPFGVRVARDGLS